MPGLTGDRRMHSFDKSLELYNYDTAAVSADTNGSALTFAATKQKDYKAVVFHDALTSIDGSNYWTVNVQASADNSTWVTVGTIQLGAAKAFYDVPLNGEFVGQKVASAAYLRAQLDETGAPGSLKVGVFLTCS